ncbi:hypothetical protein niasHT_013610 [Heterodera trifolii]|uniref:Uncharacterized protein n=1 Tax=Heterodera trifolii TaxID=157864 RepID=A0ABD2LFQ1_9BILA
MAYYGQQQPPTNYGYQPQNNNPYQAQEGVHVYAANPSNAEGGMPKNELGFNEQSIRAAFVRKVFLLVGVMLGVVTLMCAVPFVHPPLMAFTKNNHSLYFISLITFLVVYFVLICCDSVRRSFPTNLICTAILTLSIGFVTMVMTAFYSFESVLMAAGITTVSCVGIALFAMVTKRDITSLLGFVFIATMVLMMLGFLLVLWSSFSYSRPLHIVYASLGALLFMVYLAIDIQMIMGGRKYEISPEEHIFAAIILFMDIVQIFWFILSIFGDRS